MEAKLKLKKIKIIIIRYTPGTVVRHRKWLDSLWVMMSSVLASRRNDKLTVREENGAECQCASDSGLKF